MEQAKSTDEVVLAHAEELIKGMRKGNEENAVKLLDYVCSARENLLFQEVGEMTKQLHDALEVLRQDLRNMISPTRASVCHMLSKYPQNRRIAL